MEKFRITVYHESNPNMFYVDVSRYYKHEGLAYAYGERRAYEIIEDLPKSMRYVQCMVIKTTKI